MVRLVRIFAALAQLLSFLLGSDACAQYTGTSGRGEVVAVTDGIALNDQIIFRGGSGKGDEMKSYVGLLSRDIVNGGSGRGEAMASGNLLTLEDTPYMGGPGKGDASSVLLQTMFVGLWEAMENNRVVTRVRLNDAISNGVFNSTSMPVSDSRAANRSALSTHGLSPVQMGIFATGNAKPSNQLLIRGDFRSISINNQTGQLACSNQSSYPQVLWLNSDRIIVNVTLVYTDKTLATLYTSGNNSDWYNIQSGGAIRINASGLVTAVSCF